MKSFSRHNLLAGSITSPFFFALILLFSAGCNSMKVTCQYDKKADFKTYKTYSFVQSMNLPHLKSANKALFVNTVAQEMNNRGYRKSNSLTPDLWIDLSLENVKSVRTAETNDQISGMRPYRYGGGRSMSSVETHSRIKRIFVINITDGKKNTLAWEGRATAAIKDQQPDTAKDQQISHAVIRIFKKYPVGISKGN